VKFIFSTGSLYTYGVDRCFDLAAQAGFDGVEIMVDARWDTRQPAYLRRQMERTGLPISAVHSPFTPNTPGWPADEPGRIRATAGVAEAVGAPIVVHHLPLRHGLLRGQIGRRRVLLPAPWMDQDAGYRRWLREEVAAFQATTSATLCIENMPARRFLGRNWDLFAWNRPIELASFPHVTLDTTHLGTWGLEPAEVYPTLRGRVGHVHLSNFDGEEHRRPEAGRLRLDRLLGLLAADGYAGAVSIELDPSALAAGGPDEALVGQLRESLEMCREWGRRPAAG
jgi:sugar phosphate isomerase/epimerase